MSSLPAQVSCNAGRPPEPPASISQMLGLRAHPALGSFLAGRFVLATQDTGAFIPHLSCRFFYTRQSLPPLHNFPFRDYKQSPHSWTFENELSTQEGGSLWRPAVSILSPPPPPRDHPVDRSLKPTLLNIFVSGKAPEKHWSSG